MFDMDRGVNDSGEAVSSLVVHAARNDELL